MKWSLLFKSLQSSEKLDTAFITNHLNYLFNNRACFSHPAANDFISLIAFFLFFFNFAVDLPFTFPDVYVCQVWLSLWLHCFYLLIPNVIVNANLTFLWQDSYERAKNILKTHAKEHKNLAEALLTYETLDAKEIQMVLEGKKLEVRW